MTTPPPWAPRPGDNLGASRTGSRQSQRAAQDRQRRQREREMQQQDQDQSPVEQARQRQQQRREAMQQRPQPRPDVPRIGETLGARPGGRPPDRRDRPTRRELVEQVEEARAASAAERFQQAQQALGGRSVIQFLQEGGEPEQLVTLGYNRQDVQSLAAVTPFINGDSRTIDITGYLESGGDPEMLSRVVPEATVRSAQQRRSDIAALEPFTDQEGRIDVLRAREEIEDPAILERVLSQEDLQAAEALQADLEALRPFQDDEGRVDLAAALDAGVDRATLERVLDPEAIQRAEVLQADLTAVEPFTIEDDRIDVAAALEAGVPQEVLDRLEIDTAPLRQQQADLQAIQPFETEDGRVDLRAAMEAGVEPAVLERLFSAEDLEAAQEPLGFEPLAAVDVDAPAFIPRDPIADPQTPFERDAARLSEIERLTGGTGAQNRAAIAESLGMDPDFPLNEPGTSTISQEFRRFEREFTRLRDERERLINRYEASPTAVIQAAREGRELARIGAGVSNVPTADERRLMEARITLEDPQASQLQRLQARQALGLPPVGSAEFVRQLEQEGFTSQEIAALSTGDFVQQQAIQAAREGDTQRLVELGVTGDQRARFVQEVQDVDRRREILARVGTTGEEALAALREGRVTEAELREVLLPESAEGIIQVATQDQVAGFRPTTLEPQRFFGLAEEEMAVALDRRGEVINAVQELGPQAAVQQGRATADEVQSIFGEDVFQARPEEDLAISPTRTLPIRADEALTELGRMGLAGPDGVLVADAAMSGQEELLLQAGFTQGQIDAAVSQRITPTAEPRLRPAPGETLPVDPSITERLEDVRQQEELFLRDPMAAASNPQFVALSRERELLEDLDRAVGSGDMANEEALGIVQDIPAEPTPEDIVEARYNMGVLLQMSPALAPGLGPVFSATGTALTWEESSALQRGINVGADVLSIIPMATVAAGAARGAGGLTGAARAASIGREVATAEIFGPLSAITDPVGTARRGIYHPVEAVVSPRRLVGQEIITGTLRVPAESRFMSGPLVLRAPDGTMQELRAGVVGADEVKDAVSTASLQLMRRGEAAEVPIGEGASTVRLNRPAAQETLGPVAFHATPDGRNLMAGNMVIQSREGGMYFAPTPMSRFAEATSSGAEVPLSPEAARLVEAGQLSNEPVPTVIMLRDPDLLSRLEGAQMLPGGRRGVPPDTPGAVPKIFNGLAEVEAVLPDGSVLPQPSQVLFQRGLDGSRYAVAVVGEPLSASELARLRLTGARQAVGNIFHPPGVIRFEGAEQAARLSSEADDLLAQARTARTTGNLEQAASLEAQATTLQARAVAQADEAAGMAASLARTDADSLTRHADDLAAEAASLRAMGRVDEAAQVTAQANRVRRAADDAALVAGRVGGASFIPRGVRAALGQRLEVDPESGRITPREPLERPVIRPDGVRDGIVDTRRSPDPDSLRRGIGGDPPRPDIDHLPGRDIVEPRIVGDDVVRVGREPVAPDAPQPRDASVRFIRREAVDTPELTRPRVPTSAEAPRLPDSPRTPDRPRVPRTPEVPRVPTLAPPPRTPEVPRVTGVPGVPEVPRTPPPEEPPERPPRTPGIPETDGPEEDDSIRPGEHVRIVGIARGAVGDTVVDLVSGESQTVQDHPDVPSSPTGTRESFTVLSTSPEESGPVREKWGALDLWLASDGSFAWVKAGRPMPPIEEFRPANEFGNGRPRQQENTPRPPEDPMQAQIAQLRQQNLNAPRRRGQGGRGRRRGGLA